MATLAFFTQIYYLLFFFEALHFPEMRAVEVCRHVFGVLPSPCTAHAKRMSAAHIGRMSEAHAGRMSGVHQGG